ncbi:MAG: L-aspartate oxidase [Pseudomonadota bacterium]
MHTCDVLIIGSGLAACTLALSLPEHLKVLMITKKTFGDSSSAMAQGGIAAAFSSEDSFADHIRDTQVAGAGLCDESAVRYVVEHGPDAIKWLIWQGVPFDRSNNGYHLTREGGHSQRRIFHVADATGAGVQDTLMARLRAAPNVEFKERHLSIDLITGKKLGRDEQRVYGAYVLDVEHDQVETIAASHTVLATGGAGKIFLYTSNPDTATGDGIAMAWRAGCRVANLEFVQFHPTCLYHPQAKSFLITEAMRGEGALLRLPDGTRFMPEHDARAELAPRDIVARAIDLEMKKRGLDCVYLDITHQPANFIIGHFPNIHARCKELGIDITREWIPVAPAAHYTCGGIMVDHDSRTDLANLYAIGETTFTGLHGANRLASNSLLECLVYGRAAAADIARQPLEPPPPLPDWDESRVTDADEQVVITHNWHELRRFMWDYVGIVRTNKRLERAAHRIKLLREEIHDYYSNFRVSNDLIELRNLVETANLMVQCAQARHESRGLHASLDYPALLPEAKNTVLTPATG